MGLNEVITKVEDGEQEISKLEKEIEIERDCLNRLRRRCSGNQDVKNQEIRADEDKLVSLRAKLASLEANVSSITKSNKKMLADIHDTFSFKCPAHIKNKRIFCLTEGAAPALLEMEMHDNETKSQPYRYSSKFLYDYLKPSFDRKRATGNYRRVYPNTYMCELEKCQASDVDFEDMEFTRTLTVDLETMVPHDDMPPYDKPLVIPRMFLSNEFVDHTKETFRATHAVLPPDIDKLSKENIFFEAINLFNDYMSKEYDDFYTNTKSSADTANTMLKKWFENRFHTSFSLFSNQALHIPKGVSSFFSSRPNFCLISRSLEGTGMTIQKMSDPPIDDITEESSTDRLVTGTTEECKMDEQEKGRAQTVANMVLLASALAHRSLLYKSRKTNRVFEKIHVFGVLIDYEEETAVAKKLEINFKDRTSFLYESPDCRNIGELIALIAHNIRKEPLELNPWN